MLSYRHAFHAGNAADILKHSVLIHCLGYLGQKESPYLCIDTHAGAGNYFLDEGYALQNREWEGGIDRLFKAPALPPMMEDLADMVRRGPGEDRGGGWNGTDRIWYPGSPALIQALLRQQDRAACFELHGTDFAILNKGLKKDRRFTLRQEDGFAALKGLLPPPSRRACIFIDPPYEIKEDYAILPQVLAEALRRFPTGLYIIWYPLLGHRDAALPETLLGLYKGNQCRVELRFESRTEAGMYGCGLVIYNPPWTLKAALEGSMPFMAELLQKGKGSWDLEWEEKQK